MDNILTFLQSIRCLSNSKLFLLLFLVRSTYRFEEGSERHSGPCEPPPSHPLQQGQAPHRISGWMLEENT